MAYKRDATAASKAVNNLLHFCDEDRAALLEVIEDYFTSPVGLDSSDDEEHTSDRGSTAVTENKLYITLAHCK